MIKKLLFLISVGVVLFGANDHIVVGNSSAISANFTQYVIDTFTIHYKDYAGGLKKMYFNPPIWNLRVMDEGNDAGYVVLKAPGDVVGITHAAGSTVWTSWTCGDGSEEDTIDFFLPVKELWLQITIVSADSTVLLKMHGYRK